MTVDQVGNFGAVRSAVWFHMEADSQEVEYLVLSTVNDFCRKAQHAIPEINQVWEEWQEPLEAGSEVVCADGQAALDETVILSDGLYPAGGSRLAVSLYSDGAWNAAPELGSFMTGDEAEKQFDLGYALYYRNPAVVMAQEWTEQSCSIISDALEESIEFYTAEEGSELSILELSDRVSGEIDGTLRARDGSAAGSIQAHFDASYCPIRTDTRRFFYYP